MDQKSIRSIALITCADHPNGTLDDQPVIDSFQQSGVPVTPIIWDQVSPDSLKKYSCTIVRSPWDYHRKIGQMNAWLEQAKQVQLLNSAELIQWNISKTYLFDLEKRSVSIVPTKLFAQMEEKDFLNEIKRTGWTELVIKPVISASAFKTFRLKKSEIIDRLMDISSIWEECDVLVQPFCESVETEGEYSLIFFSDGTTAQFSHAIVKKPKSKDFRVQEEFGGSVESCEAPQNLIQFGEKTLSMLKHDWLYARVDVVRYRDDYVLGELELFEPQLFFRFESKAAPLFVDCVLKRLAGQ